METYQYIQTRGVNVVKMPIILKAMYKSIIIPI